MWIKIAHNLHTDFPNLQALICSVNGLEVTQEKNKIFEFKNHIITNVKTKYELDTLRDISNFRAYRDFYWRVKIDPTKIRPASEALVRRILAEKPIPSINTVVDVYNLVSISTEISIAAFDRDTIDGELVLRYADTGEPFRGIGWSEWKNMKGGEIVVSDKSKLVAIYPYRDADDSKITTQSKNALFLICGAPGIEIQYLKETAHTTIEQITRFCGGTGRIGLNNII